jgi:DnaJ-class molecular chaperone
MKTEDIFDCAYCNGSGKDRKGDMHKRKNVFIFPACPACEGKGKFRLANAISCVQCKGSGENRKEDRPLREKLLFKTPCSFCKGLGKVSI